MLIISFVVLTIFQYAAAADKRHLQSTMNMDIPAVAWDVSTYVEGTTPTFFTAEEVTNNTGDNNILSEFIRGFGALSNRAFEEMFGKKKQKMNLPTRGLRTDNDIRELQQLMPLVVTDIPCPDTITYTPPSGVTCLQFGIEIDTGNMAPEDVLTFEDYMATAISDGQLYDTIKFESPDSHIQGVGDPGNGFMMIPDGPASTMPATTEAPDIATMPAGTEASTEEPGTIVDIALGNPDFSTLVAAVSAAGLVDALSGDGPLTVFAPTNDAFAALPEGTVETLLQPENIGALTDILTYHVVPAEAPSTSLVNGDVVTLNGDPVLVTVSDDGVMINDANVIIPDIMASNGIIHVIDKVLIPPEGPTTLPEGEEELGPALPATTEVPPDTTEAPATTEAPSDTTEAPITTDAPITTEAPIITTEAVTTEAPVEIPDVPVPAPEIPEGGATKATKVPIESKATKAPSVAKAGKSSKEVPIESKATKAPSVAKAGKSSKAFATKSGKATHEIVVKDPKAEKISVAKAEKMVSKASKAKTSEGAKSGKALDKASKAVKEMSVRL